MDDIKSIAEAFSTHRFEAAYAYLSDDVRWNVVGGDQIHGKESVIENCKRSAAYLSQVNTEMLELRFTRSENRVVVETLTEYVEDAGASPSVVASCDIYDFENDELCLITSYNIEVSGQESDA